MRFNFTTTHFASVLRLSIYSSEPTTLLPLLLHEADESKDFSAIAVQFLLLTRSYADVVAAGMNNTVACTEDIPFYDPKTVDRAKLANTFLGTEQIDGLLAVCRIWPRGPMDPDFHAPLHSTVPALLLSGSADPITPPQYAEEAGLSTVVLVDETGQYVRSDAALRVLRHIGGFYRFVGSLLLAIPRPVRDWGYRFIAKNRYRWFGEKDTCRLPTAEERAVFLP